MSSYTCKICGKPGADIAYFCTGMVEVVYLHPRMRSANVMGRATGVDQRPSS